MSGVDPDDTAALRRVALELQDRFVTNGNGRTPEVRQPDTTPSEQKRELDEKEGEAQQKPDEVEARPVIVNAPLDFTLKMLDVQHPYLKQRGLTPETISHFGLGYCSRGLMQGRIAIPLHDAVGQLIGYAGRLVEDNKITADNPKYRLPRRAGTRWRRPRLP